MISSEEAIYLEFKQEYYDPWWIEIQTGHIAMKYWTLLFVSISLLTACAEPLNVDSLISKDGISYSPGSHQPFSGKAFQIIPKGDVNDSIRVEGKYLNGLRHGSWIGYYANGQLAELKTYENGLNHGKYLRQYPNGQL